MTLELLSQVTKHLRNATLLTVVIALVTYNLFLTVTAILVVIAFLWVVSQIGRY